MIHLDPDGSRPDLHREMWVYGDVPGEINSENLKFDFKDGLEKFVSGLDVLLTFRFVPTESAPKRLVNRYKQQPRDDDDEEEIDDDEDDENRALDFSIYYSQLLNRRQTIDFVTQPRVVYPSVERWVERWISWPRDSIASVILIAISQARQ